MTTGSTSSTCGPSRCTSARTGATRTAGRALGRLEAPHRAQPPAHRLHRRRDALEGQRLPRREGVDRLGPEVGAQVVGHPVGVAGGGRRHHDRPPGAQVGEPGDGEGARRLGNGQDRMRTGRARTRSQAPHAAAGGGHGAPSVPRGTGPGALRVPGWHHAARGRQARWRRRPATYVATSAAARRSSAERPGVTSATPTLRDAARAPAVGEADRFEHGIGAGVHEPTATVAGAGAGRDGHEPRPSSTWSTRIRRAARLERAHWRSTSANGLRGRVVCGIASSPEDLGKKLEQLLQQPGEDDARRPGDHHRRPRGGGGARARGRLPSRSPSSRSRPRRCTSRWICCATSSRWPSTRW